MHRLKRPTPPELLQANGQEWTDKYLAKRAKAKKEGRKIPRPHFGLEVRAQIVEKLEQMNGDSFCSYCESFLDSSKPNVEHFEEVSDKPEKAFDWENLFLSCNTCNSNKKNSNMVNPCGDNPREHFTFDNVLAIKKTDLGRKTIKMLDLNGRKRRWRRTKLLEEIGKLKKNLRSSSKRGKRWIEARKLVEHGSEYCSFYLAHLGPVFDLPYVDPTY